MFKELIVALHPTSVHFHESLCSSKHFVKLKEDTVLFA